MTPVVVTTFLAILVMVAGFGVLLTAAFAVLERSGMVPGSFGAVRSIISPIALWLVFVVAVTAMAGSLYFSEGAGYIPCTLCWDQRIAMYPLVVVVGIAAVRGDLRIRPYVGAVAGIGAALSLYHIGVERLPGLPTEFCTLDVPCDLIWFERFGFITIPVMAFVGFVAILTLLFAFGGSGRATERPS